jgi:hypothetical protein
MVHKLNIKLHTYSWDSHMHFRCVCTIYCVMKFIVFFDGVFNTIIV